MLEAIPKYRLRRFARERRKPIATACRDEIDLVVEIPVLEPMAIIPRLDGR
jgi:hypothetical protein